MTIEEMIKLAESNKPNKLDNLKPTQKEQFIRFMFGDKFINSSDSKKGEIRTYEEE